MISMCRMFSLYLSVMNVRLKFCYASMIFFYVLKINMFPVLLIFISRKYLFCVFVYIDYEDFSCVFFLYILYR